MSGQIDVGWAIPPFALNFMERGEVRQIATGNDAAAFRNQTIRLVITSTPVLEARKDALTRFMAAYRETIDFLYADAAGPELFAKFAGVSDAIARRTRQDFFPKSALDPDRIQGLDAIMADAIAFKYITTPLTPSQVSELIQIPPR